ncbi:MAG: HAMP domain-containing histidine kinase [Lachnospiraceae bacterium]|nr:HAMP domain-containing histidine kinase [Lachnospiraceae bacterium]
MDISGLKSYIIKKFILAVIFVSIAEYLMLKLVNFFFLPMVSLMFFNGEDVASLKTSGVVIALFIAIGSIILELAEFIVPSGLSLTLSGFRSVIESRLQEYIVNVPAGEKYISLQTGEKLILIIMLAAMTFLLLLPYIAGAIIFSADMVKRFRAIEDKEREKEKAREAVRNLMLSDIAHDLRTPMTTVSGYAKALSDDMVPEDKKRGYLEAIQAKSGRMNELITLLFDYVRIDSAGFKLIKEDTDLCELVRECAAAIYQDIEDAKMELTVEVPEERYMIDADRVQLSRVISNLLVNALKHNGENTKIGIYLKKDGTAYRLMIADSGNIIEEKVAAHIFEPFVMGDESRSSKGGTGLGLSVSQKIVDLHGFSLRLIQKPYIRKYDLPAFFNKMFMITIRQR